MRLKAEQGCCRRHDIDGEVKLEKGGATLRKLVNGVRLNINSEGCLDEDMKMSPRPCIGGQEGQTIPQWQKSWGRAPIKLWFERKVTPRNVHVCGGTHDAHELNNLLLECLVRSAQICSRNFNAAN